MSDYPVTVLIAVQSGALREGLRSLLETLSQVTVVGEVIEQGAVAHTVAGQRPGLVLLDGNLWSEAWWLLLGDVRARFPHTRWVILAETELQRQRASNAGVDAAILQGLPPPQLLLFLQQLLGIATDHTAL